MEYCIELMGIDHVGCGPDTLYGDHVGLYRLYDEQLTRDGMGHYPRPRQQEDIKAAELPAYVKGLENPTEGVHNAIRWMVKHGYSDSEITKVAGKNALRVLEEVW
jgi:membrane dipeptidase